LLERKLISEFKKSPKKIVFVLGKIQENQQKWTIGNSTFYNYLLSTQLQKIINSSKVVISRSGYSSIMDLAVLGKKVFFIPTENQPEQEYLATYLKRKGMAPFSTIANFSEEKLFEIQNNKGLATKKMVFDVNLFGLFKSK
jgi:uncharacterized protein (TIGR00661 family)